MKRSLSALLLIGLLVSCEKAAIPVSQPGYSYFPLEVGRYTEYEVSETQYALPQSPQMRTYLVRETIGEKYTDANGQDVYRIERASQAGTSWAVDSVWLAWRTINRAFRIENGVTFVKLEFPVKKNSQWDGNLFNSHEEQTYRIQDAVGTSRKIGTNVFDKTLTVVQQNDSTLLTLRRSKEIYAEGIGLIFKESTFYNYCETPDCVGKGIIKNGLSRITTIKNFGK